MFQITTTTTYYIDILIDGEDLKIRTCAYTFSQFEANSRSNREILNSGAEVLYLHILHVVEKGGIHNGEVAFRGYIRNNAGDSALVQRQMFKGVRP